VHKKNKLSLFLRLYTRKLQEIII